MQLNSKEIFSRLLKVFGTDKMNYLSRELGYKESWAATTRTRGGIPLEACVIATQRFNVTMDYLLLGIREEYEGNEEFDNDITILKQSITDAIHRSEKFGILTINDDWSTSAITDQIIGEIRTTFKETDNKDRQNVERLLKRLKED
jgi:hypothetical protein